MLSDLEVLKYLRGYVLSAIFIAIPVAISCYVFGLVIYRLYFHPLGAIPGPFLARVTDWYNVIQATGDDRHLDFYRLHQRYGPVVRYGPSRVSFNTVSALNKVYGARSNVQKSDVYNVFNLYFPEPCITSAVTHKIHAPRRRLFLQALSEANVQTMEELIVNNIRIFCDLLKPPEGDGTTWSAPVNISQRASYLTFDLMSTLCFSSSYDMLRTSKHRWIIPVLQQATQGLIILGHMQWIAKLGVDKALFGHLMSANDRLQVLSKRMALERYEKSRDLKTKDVFYFLENSEDPETGARLTMEQLMAESGLLIIAGSDTTATAIASTIFYLLHNPTCLSRLREEILSKFTSLEDIHGGTTLSSCSYLRACIKESLRIAPGVPGMLAREVLRGGITVDGHIIPATMDVGVPVYAIHHNETYFPSPFRYLPERWLPSPTAEPSSVSHPDTIALASSAFCPFSHGAFGCTGKPLVYRELTIVIARLVFLFEWRVAPGTHLGEGDPKKKPGSLRHRPDEFQGKDCFVWVCDGPMVQFRERMRGSGNP